MARFAEPSVLDDTGNTKAELKAYVEGLKPQSDLVVDGQLTADNNEIGLSEGVPRWVKYTHTYADFPTAATTSADDTVVSLGDGAVVHAVKVITTTAFVGTGVTACTVDVGLTSSAPTEYINLKSVFALTTTAGWEYSTLDFLTENGSTSVLVRIICTSANCSALTAGSFDVWVLQSIANSGL